jgi:hypothetical protein
VSPSGCGNQFEFGEEQDGIAQPLAAPVGSDDGQSGPSTWRCSAVEEAGGGSSLRSGCYSSAWLTEADSQVEALASGDTSTRSTSAASDGSDCSGDGSEQGWQSGWRLGVRSTSGSDVVVGTPSGVHGRAMRILARWAETNQPGHTVHLGRARFTSFLLIKYFPINFQIL